MARGTQLGEIIDMFRAEIGVSLDRASSQNSFESHKYCVRNAQTWLYENYDWPFLRVHRDEPLQAGARIYSFPPDLTFEGVTNVFTKFGEKWEPVAFGIGPEHYNAHAEDVRVDPVMRWDAHEDGGYEVWPTPASSGTLRMYGKRKLQPFTDESHVATLDDYLIALFAAWKHLGEKGAAKKAEFDTYLMRLRGASGAKKEQPFVLGGAAPRPSLRPGIDFIAGR